MEEERYEQMSIFDDILEDYKITKPVRLISFFSGIEAQFKALSYLGSKLGMQVESYKTCEWAYNSIIACNSIHSRDFTDYSEGKSKEELIESIKGISVDYNVPLTDEQLAKKPISWIKSAYNSCVANHNLINIMNVHGKDLEIVDTDKYDYMLTYSFPCQDLSLAGLRAGMSVSQADGGTRSGLLWEVERILNECKDLNCLPQILIMENVPQIHSEKDYPNFEKWMLALENLGYNNYYKDLNSKQYGIPQNRVRTFMVSILGHNYNYKFPLPFSRELTLKDMLEDTVDEKYYLSKKMVDYLTGVNQKESKYDRGAVFERNFDPNKEVAATITTAAGQRPTDNFIVDLKRGYSIEVDKESDKSVDGVNILGNYSKSDFSQTPIVDKNGIAPTFTENHGQVTAIVTNGAIRGRQNDNGVNEQRLELGNGETLNTITTVEKDNVIIVKDNATLKICDNTSRGYKEAHDGDGINISSRMKHQRGNVQNGLAQTLKTTMEVGVVIDDNVKLLGGVGEKKSNNGTQFYEQNRIYDDKLATALPANSSFHPYYYTNLRIRKLTPKEAMRLMAFQDIDCDHMQEIGLGDGAIYHCAGDSIVVTCLIGIIAKLYGISNKEIPVLIKDYIKTIIDKF